MRFAPLRAHACLEGTLAPVRFSEGRWYVPQHTRQHRPAIVLCFGLAGSFSAPRCRTRVVVRQLYIYIYMYREREITYIYIYIYIYIHVYIYIYICVMLFAVSLQGSLWSMPIVGTGCAYISTSCARCVLRTDTPA